MSVLERIIDNLPATLEMRKLRPLEANCLVQGPMSPYHLTRTGSPDTSALNSTWCHRFHTKLVCVAGMDPRPQIQVCSGLNCVPSNRCASPNPWYLWRWSCLEMGLFRCDHVKIRSYWLGWVLTPVSGVLTRREGTKGHSRAEKAMWWWRWRHQWCRDAEDCWGRGTAYATPR